MSAQTVLVVEDNPITRRMMRFALESEGFRVLEAGDGQSAIAAAAASAPGLVLQDYVLPDMDGVQLIEALRLLPGMAETPILIVTGLVSQIDALRRQALENTTFLPKPIAPSRLVEVVRSLLSGTGADHGGGRRLLVVDDEALNLRLASLRLRDAGFEVDTAESGEAALEIARRSLPDAVLSDVLMPGMDGFLLCRAIRRDPVLAHLPVILLSASYVDQDDQKLAFDMGASALLLRTSDLAPAIKALGEAFSRQKTLGPRATPALRAPDISPLHKERVQIQLERQMARNDALVRQGAIQAAALSVVRGLAEALARPRDLANVLGDVLVHCLDATGVSTGLLYLAEPDGGFHLRAQAGLPLEARGEAGESFGHPEVLRRCLDAGYPLAVNRGDDALADPALRAFVERVGCSSALFIPFVVAQERVGVLLLAADAQDFAEPAWLGFARTLAVQFGQTIAVGQSLTRGAASEARYQTIMEQANDAILLLEDDRIVEANQQAESLLARPRSEMIGRAYGEFVVADEGSPAPIVFGASITRLENQRLRRGDGSIVFADVSGSPVRVGDETIAVLILRDITERRRAEGRLQESEEQYRLLFEGNPHPMWVYDPVTLVFLAVNDCAVRMYGYSRAEFLGMKIQDVWPADDVPALLDTITAGGHETAGTGIFRHRLKSEAIVDVEVASNSLLFRGRPARLVLVTDVSEKRRLETQLLQAQKMEAVGRLAGGVAHDFNNLLGVITGYSDLLSRMLEPDHRGRGKLDEIQKAAYRAAGLTRQLLAFSRKQVLETRTLDLNHIVDELGKMLQRLIGEDVQFISRTTPGLWTIRADGGQIEQVIVNLVVNARDAMPRGGAVVLETSNVTIDEVYARSHAEVKPGRYVMLTVSDTGEGMDEITQARIFEPFFTTKAEGKGTGLGLATVFGIVKQSGGHIRVYSELGVGSTFKVYLPQAEPGARVENAPHDAAPAGGKETILLVEDAEALRIMIREILESAGYDVIECVEPAEVLRKPALDVARAHLLLTDVIMPRASGPDIARSLRAKHPALKVLFMSGYTDQAIGHHGFLDGGAPLLEKPFTTDGLLRKVRSVLDGA